MSELWTWSAAKMADAVRGGKVPARVVLEVHAARIAEVNPQVNAVTAEFGEAASEADRIDALVRDGVDPGPLAGVPMTVKENIDVAGHPTTHGVPRFKDAVANADAPPVRRLRAAGAIPIGHGNMPDLTLAGNVTVSQLFGETVNPWGAIRTPGGSSGGDAAAVASGMAAIGLGNDSGGSVRLPALFCGLTALKPSYGRVATDHRIGGSDPTLASQLFPVDGPIARTVEDLALTFDVLAGTDPADPRAIPYGGRLPAVPRRVAVCTDPAGLGVDPRIRAEIDKAAAALAEAGYEVEEAEPPRLADALTSYGTLITAEFSRRWPSIRPLLTEESAQHMELSFAQRPESTLDDYLDATATRFGVMREWAAFAERYPVILGPVSTWRPFDADPFDPEQGLRVMFGMRLCTATTCVGVPAVAVPTGIDDGQPLGVQLIGPRHREDVCLAAAGELEARFGTFGPVREPR
ncbi:indole acetimide hydrolase [Amycolatopsis sp. WAC 04182]|uniref:amidase n=1 Tax=Amycolatopsis sp. WAC 04182 TaxID=2203198 RepID=UPI000F77B776|nr:amidase [Amycolatopsis sp. WAC 04182]RSN55375.1 indole acetimide hydrolase [Amycolatopsis sp. WAC 04182]